MHMTKDPCLLLVLLCCELCSSIKVPVIWELSARSEVKNEPTHFVEAVELQNERDQSPNQQPIPIEYFEYTAQKPKFAANIAEFYGVQNPQEHYKAYPVNPYTGKHKPTLGIHHMLDEEKKIFKPFQNYVNQNSELNRYVKPTATNIEVFHPYEAEQPALQQIYKDPVLTKIRNDLRDNKNRLQAYEEKAGEPNVSKDEYLESPEKTDGKLFPHKNIPAQYEVHRPERRPIYYRKPLRDAHRDNILNKRFKHPWNQHAKIRPMHYRPLHYHIHNLRQQHAMKYDDERNEYPQVSQFENIGEPQDGYDIYVKGKQKYEQLRNNLDESVSKVALQNRPPTYQKLELQKPEPEDENDSDEFIPIKNYAQVRKTETYKHLPRIAAFDDAETLEEIRNAPRLREAVKSTKAQTVYSEEGYEDSAYDHAGEQKHASDHEGHGGFLKEHENSGGLYKIPTVSGKYQDASGSEYRDNTEHGKKWKNMKKEDEEAKEKKTYSEKEHEDLINSDLFESDDPDAGNRSKRQNPISKEDDNDYQDDDDNSDNDSSNDSDDDCDDDVISSDSSESKSDSSQESDENEKQLVTHILQENRTNAQHDVGKREINYEIPEINITSTLSFQNEDSKLAEQKLENRIEDIKQKYPYYFKKFKGINKDSPLRYAENLNLMPRKSNGGTEFYDSRSRTECSEVDDDVNPIPEKLKKGENPTEENSGNDDESSAEGKFDTVKKQPRLKGLGDKIDCFKAKYFGQNPLDSPFFKEEIINNPEPIRAPKHPIYRIKNDKGETAQESQLNTVIDSSKTVHGTDPTNIFIILDKLRGNLLGSLNNTYEPLQTFYVQSDAQTTNGTQQASAHTDISKNINSTTTKLNKKVIDAPSRLLNPVIDNLNSTYSFFQNKEDITKLPIKLRKKRATPFVYEPYKIIRDSQVQDSKKTTTTSNISPLIKQLQTSRVAERVSRSNKDDRQKSHRRTYVDIGKKDRTKPTKNENSDPTFVDVSVDHRRGEPRYEIRPSNHKPEYSPVENKKAMSVDAYKLHTNPEKNKEITTQKPLRGTQRYRLIQTTTKPKVQTVSRTVDIENAAASNIIKQSRVAPTNQKAEEKHTLVKDSEEESGEDYDDDEDEGDEHQEEEEEIAAITTTTTTTTTPKPLLRRRTKVERSNQLAPLEENTKPTPEMDLLKFVTRFRNYSPDKRKHTKTKEELTLRPVKQKDIEEDDVKLPKYREKKKKTHTSTFVTDTKKYGGDDEEDMKKEVDALIGIQTNMKDYMPMYEKDEEDKDELYRSKKNEKHKEHYDENDDENNEEVENDDNRDDENEDDNDEEDEDDGIVDDNVTEEEEEGAKLEEKAMETEEVKKIIAAIEVTTPEPTKRTLARTTDAFPATRATRIRPTTPSTLSRHHIHINHKPVITRKKIEIHKELPIITSSPNVTRFKQDIKEVEIIKEIPAKPKKKPQKNIEALELYKDDDLAKEINNLGDVEVFREKLDLEHGPKHGGNYRHATKEDIIQLKPTEITTAVDKDAETSQSKSTKQIELDQHEPRRLHGGNLKASSFSDLNQPTNSDRSAKLIELSDPPVQMHGGNLKYDNKRRGGGKNEKLIELDDHDDDDHSPRQDNNYKSHNSNNNRMHGGNYRSAKLIKTDESTDDVQAKSSINIRKNAAGLLSSFVQAVPILTTTPGYILDPSKRMYYYVDA